MTSSFNLDSNCVKFRLVEFDCMESIVNWVLEQGGSQADLHFDFSNHTTWVVVPEKLLLDFLVKFGSQVSAV